MRAFTAALSIGALLSLAPLAASAAPTIHHADGLTSAEVAKWLQDAGYTATVGVDEAGDPKISSAVDGINFNVYFYDCEAKPRCKAIQFSAGFDLDTPLAAAKINEWNKANRYLKAYIDEQGDPHVDYDVNLNAGRTKEGLDDDFSVWTSMVGDFATFVGWD